MDEIQYKNFKTLSQKLEIIEKLVEKKVKRRAKSWSRQFLPNPIKAKSHKSLLYSAFPQALRRISPELLVTFISLHSVYTQQPRHIPLLHAEADQCDNLVRAWASRAEPVPVCSVACNKSSPVIKETVKRSLHEPYSITGTYPKEELLSRT